MAKPINELFEKTMSPESRKRAREEADRIIKEINFLNELRKHREMTQKDLAKKLDTSQVNVSLTERRNGVTLGTLRKYIEAMGGKLEIKAKFPNEVIKYSY